jgi:hypothetical protein
MDAVVEDGIKLRYGKVDSIDNKLRFEIKVGYTYCKIKV